MENLNELILSDHRIMMGKPVLKGIRITVESVLRKMAEGADNENIDYRIIASIREAGIEVKAVLMNQEV
ncbi:MAG: hypothetical protein ACI9V1_000893 [Spirosomataceae bacterium]|jgi:uncharacterized protein (DUF433 family)